MVAMATNARGRGRVLTLGATDVVLGRGATICKLEGNVRFRSIVCMFKTIYQEATKKKKQLYVDSVIEAVENLSPPGRFLEFNPTSKALSLVVTRDRIYEKISQALRDKKNCVPMEHVATCKMDIPSQRNILFSEKRKVSETRPAMRTKSKKHRSMITVNHGSGNSKSLRNTQSRVQHRIKIHYEGNQSSIKGDQIKDVPVRLITTTVIEPSLSSTTSTSGEETSLSSTTSTLVKKPSLSCKPSSAEGVMSNDSIWTGPDSFELFSFLMEDENGIKGDCLELDAMEVQPSLVSLSDDSVASDQTLDQSKWDTKNSTGKRSTVSDALEMKKVKAVFSELGKEGEGLVSDVNFDQVFSIEFESEVVSMVSFNESNGATDEPYSFDNVASISETS